MNDGEDKNDLDRAIKLLDISIKQAELKEINRKWYQKPNYLAAIIPSLATIFLLFFGAQSDYIKLKFKELEDSNAELNRKEDSFLARKKELEEKEIEYIKINEKLNEDLKTVTEKLKIKREAAEIDAYVNFLSVVGKNPLSYIEEYISSYSYLRDRLRDAKEPEKTGLIDAIEPQLERNDLDERIKTELYASLRDGLNSAVWHDRLIGFLSTLSSSNVPLEAAFKSQFEYSFYDYNETSRLDAIRYLSPLTLDERFNIVENTFDRKNRAFVLIQALTHGDLRLNGFDRPTDFNKLDSKSKSYLEMLYLQMLLGRVNSELYVNAIPIEFWEEWSKIFGGAIYLLWVLDSKDIPIIFSEYQKTGNIKDVAPSLGEATAKGEFESWIATSINKNLERFSTKNCVIKSLPISYHDDKSWNKWRKENSCIFDRFKHRLSMIKKSEAD